jgi:Tfp pilus assembly protein PilO
MAKLKNQITMAVRVQVALIALVGACAAAFYLGWYRPTNQKLADLADQTTLARRNLDLALAQARKVPIVRYAVAELQNKLKYSKRLPAQPDLGEFINQITAISRQTKVRKLDYSFPGADLRNDNQDFNALPVELKIDGDFLSVFAFLKETENMPRLTRISSITIQGETPDPDNADSQTGDVQVDITMDLYFSEG